jgi:hypothetical protein
MTRINTLLLATCFSLGAAGPGLAATMTKLQQCRYKGPVMSTCSELMGPSVFEYTDDVICDLKQPSYTIKAQAMGMNKYAVAIRRGGRATTAYRIGVSGYRNAQYSFMLDGAYHLVGTDTMLVIRRHEQNRVVEVWKRQRCTLVSTNVDELEQKATKAGKGH